jgi:hypothetical protein
MSNFREDILSDSDLLRQIKSLEGSGLSIKILDDRLIISSPERAVLQVCFQKSHIYAFTEKSDLYRKKPPQANDPPQPKTYSSLELRIAELEGMLSHLRQRGLLAVAQRNQWEKRALAAEEKLANADSAQGGPNKKYEHLRRFLAKEFHPDHTSSSGIEKLVRTEIFKMVWAKVEELDRSDGPN